MLHYYCIVLLDRFMNYIICRRKGHLYIRVHTVLNVYWLMNGSYNDNKQIKFSSYIRKFRWDRLHSHIQGARGIVARFLKWSPASSGSPIMTKLSQYNLQSNVYLVMVYTVSWWIRILNCIEGVPQVHFSIQLKFKLEFFHLCQLEIKLRSAVKNKC